MSRRKRIRNNVRVLREELLMSKAELARRAEVSPITINRVESGEDCRLDTKRKIILALGKKLAEKAHVFPDLAKDADATNPGQGVPAAAVGRSLDTTTHEDE